ncbi:MAG: hypothetical protein C0594_07410 [Marinilabiliales bacterium]|nr:MAG: hypothetical protein C0594_07410 [Marinilabiliales bacterium]
MLLSKGRLLITVFLTIINLWSFANSIDSLKLQMEKAGEDSSKIILLSNAIQANWQNTEMVDEIEQLTKMYLSDSAISSACDYLYTLASFSQKADNYKTSIRYYKLAADCNNSKGQIMQYATILGYLGYMYYVDGNFNEALKVAQKSLRIMDSLGYPDNSPMAYITAGYVCRDTKRFPKALEYFGNAERVTKEGVYSHLHHITLNEIGNVYLMMEEYEKALTYQKRSIGIIKENGNTASLCFAYNDIAITYKSMNFIDTAKSYYFKALKVSREINNEYAQAANLINISTTYSELNMRDSAKIFFRQTLEMCDRLKLKSLYKDVYYALADFNKRNGQYKEALENTQLYMIYYDSLHNEEIEKQLGELEARYESEKKEKEIQLLMKDQQLKQVLIEKQDIKVQKQQKAIYFFLSIILLFLALVIVVYSLFRSKKKANIKLRKQKEEIIEKNEELHQQSEEILAINEKLNSINAELLEKNEEIWDSMSYAERIQRSLIPSAGDLKELFAVSFVFYLPKDIIGGDFFWLTKINNYKFLALADCTGHGVPGAIMSVLGTSLLNEIVVEMNVEETDEILNHLRKKVISSLGYKKGKNAAKDGMDIMVLRVDNEGNIQCSGANQRMYLISRERHEVECLYEHKNLSNQQSFFYELKTDNMPVGFYYLPEEKGFAKYQFKYMNGDKIFLFSDGFADQLGGEKGKKYKYNNFRKLIQQSAVEPIDKQEVLFKTELERWKGDNEQVDDVSVLGIRL